MNKAILIGNLTRDPESRTTSSGVSCTTFTLAVNRTYTNQQGVREADFINIVTWRQRADLCSRYLSKGSRVGIVGQIQTRSYDAQDGTRRYVTEVVADEIEFINTRQGAGRPTGGDEPPMPPEPPAQSAGGASGGGFADVDDDELPF